MHYNHQVQIQCQTSVKGYHLLSVYNFHVNAFLYLFPEAIITDLRMYWIDGDKDCMTKLLMPVPIHTLNFNFDGFDIQILTVEIELNNGFLIDTNLSDELFCRVPPDYPVDELIEIIKQTDQQSNFNTSRETISSLAETAWQTTVING
ncbi:MAG: hypothetical protein HRT61_08860 [Ekhidna sp.]|nr:hypothetical protein [Ekhidna sp.]